MCHALFVVGLMINATPNLTSIYILLISYKQNVDRYLLNYLQIVA